jgi:serine/threonine protein kinase
MPTLPSAGRSDPGRGVRSDPGRPVRSDPGRTGEGVRTSPRSATDPGEPRKAGPVERPKQFGRYYLVDRLGEGGMAEVYTAVAFGAEKFRRTFVVKLLHSSAQRTPSLVEMFIDEAKLASNLVHSNIIPVYDFGKMGDEYFMAQEYVLGRDLRKLVTTSLEKERKLLDPRLSVYIARQALHALEYAHTQKTSDERPMGIVHRDVSPNNILFDFGIAKADEGRLHQTQAGVVKGNVQYMSPEQARGEPVDARADLYSLGLVLYFLLTGRSLYRGESAYELLVQAAQGLTEKLMPSLQKLPPPLGAVLRVALEPDREQRFQTATAFENALSGMPTGTAAELARVLQRLFGEDLKAEQARFLSIEPPPADEDAPAGS